MNDDKRRGNAAAGLMLAGSAYGALIVGVFGLFAAIVAFGNGEMAGAGLCLVASALAFGLLANACLRN